MSNHLTKQEIERFQRRKLSPSELLATGDHLSVCATCRQRMVERARVEDTVCELRSQLRLDQSCDVSHLDYEHLAAYVDGQLDEVEQEIAVSHLEICATCATDLEDLREARAMLCPLAIRSKRSWWPALDKFRRAPSLRAFAVVATMMVVGLAFWALRSHRMKNAPDVQAESHGVVVALQQGATRITVDMEGNLEGADLPLEYRTLVARAMLSGRVQIPAGVGALIQPRGQLLSPSSAKEAIELTEPLGTAVETDRPVFRWQPLTEATSYQVDVYDSSFEKVAGSREIIAHEWSPETPLRRGETYVWQITARIGQEKITAPAPPAPEAKFIVLDAGTAARLEFATREYPQQPLLLGVLYAQAGVLDRAEKELRAVLSQNPQTDVAKKLIESVQSARRPGR